MIEYAEINREMVEIDGDTFYLEHNPNGTSYDGWSFLVENWYKPKRIFDKFPERARPTSITMIQRGVMRLASYILRNEKGEVVAVSTYNTHPKKEQSHLFLTAVDSNYQKRGIGIYLEQRSVEEIISVSDVGADKPVEIRAEADSHAGKKTLARLKEYFGDRIKLMVIPGYDDLGDEDLPEPYKYYDFDWGIGGRGKELEPFAAMQCEELFPRLEEPGKASRIAEFVRQAISANDDDRLSFIVSADDTIVALAIHKWLNQNRDIQRDEGRRDLPENDADEPSTVEIIFIATLPEHGSSNFLEVLLTEKEKEIFGEDDEVHIVILTHDPKLIEVATKKRQYEVIDLHEYARQVKNERQLDMEDLAARGFKALIKRGFHERPYEEIK